MRSHTPLPPTEPRQGCERTAQLSQKNGALARLGSQPLRHMNANTSADGRLGLGPHTGQSDAPVGTKAHAQGGEGAATSNPRAGLAAELDLSSKETERSNDLPHGGVDGSMQPNERSGNARSGLRRDKSSDKTQA